MAISEEPVAAGSSCSLALAPGPSSNVCGVAPGPSSGVSGVAPSERRSMASLLTGRRKSSAKPSAPTLVVCDDSQRTPTIREPGGLEPGPAGGPGPSGLSCPHQLSVSAPERPPEISQQKPNAAKKKKLSEIIFSKPTQKVVCGFFVTCGVTLSWVATTNVIKLTYFGSNDSSIPIDTNRLLEVIHQGDDYDAPFLTAWLLSGVLVLFYPIFCLLQCLSCTRKNTAATSTDSLIDCIRYFRDRGLSLGPFVWRLCLFCLIWVLSTYLYVRSLRVLTCSDVTALLAASVAFVYLLSWVVLHEQFVGIRIVAVIMCNTGIALLAYMDGVTKSPTLGTVVMTATASATTAVFKVFYKKMMGGYVVGPASLFFSLIALISCLLFWPLLLVLTLTGAEQLNWSAMPWLKLTAAGVLWLLYNMLSTFGLLITYEFFITLGVLLSIPACAAIDIRWYGETFNSMQLSGMVLIFCGFILVLFPSNWPDYIRTVIRWGRRQNNNGQQGQGEPIDYRTGVISRSRLRSPSGHVR